MRLFRGLSHLSHPHHKKTMETNNRVPLGALLFGCIVSFVARNLYLSTDRRNPF